MNKQDSRRFALLVEDDPVSRAFLADALAALGWKVSACANVSPALQHARSHAFDVFVFDRNLPEGSGEALLAAIRADAASPSHQTKALALTAEPDPSLHVALRAMGFDAVATKPIALDALAGALESLGFAAEKNVAATPSALAMEAFAQVPIWDDAAGLRAVGGNAKSLATLRDMLKKELPIQCARIETALPDDPAAACAELHKLRAACGFTGAAQLAQAVSELDAILKAGGDARAAREAFFAVAKAIADQ